MSLHDAIRWVLFRVPGLWPKSGYRVNADGERGIWYSDPSGMYVVDAFFRTGVQDHYGFRRSDIYKYDYNRSVSEGLSELNKAKAQEIERRVREWLDSKGIGHDADEGREERVKNFVVSPDSGNHGS